MDPRRGGGVREDGRIEADAAGIANLNSGVEMTLLLTGSITGRTA